MKKSIFILVFSLLLTSSLFAGGKVLFVDSYHAGYAWSDGLTDGIKDFFKEKSGVELKIVRMDTKRNTSEDFKKKSALRVKKIIENFKPDVVIASDDNASKYLIVPYYKGKDLPFVFCGVNWDASVYGFPCKNVTGMLEVTPVPQLLIQLRDYAKVGTLGVLGPELITARKETQQYRSIFKLNFKEYYANNFEEYKSLFKKAQKEVGMLILLSDGGLYPKDKLEKYVLKHTKIPTGSSYDFMAPYALINFAKSAKEQGLWAASAAFKILNGTSPADIPITKNQQGDLIINVKLMQKLKIEIPYSVLQSATKIIE